MNNKAIEEYNTLKNLFPWDASQCGYWKDTSSPLWWVTGLPYQDLSTKNIRILFADGQKWSKASTLYRQIRFKVTVRLMLPFSVQPIHFKRAMNNFTEGVNPNVTNWEDTLKDWGFPTDFQWDLVKCKVSLLAEQNMYSAVKTHFPQWVKTLWEREYPETYNDYFSLDFALKAKQWEAARSILTRLDKMNLPQPDPRFVQEYRYQKPKVIP